MSVVDPRASSGLDRLRLLPTIWPTPPLRLLRLELGLVGAQEAVNLVDHVEELGPLPL